MAEADGTTHRLDAFTDAAFAFSVTLLVVGAGGDASDASTLRQSVASLPAFAIGFAIIAMFWRAHVAWRRLRGQGDWLSMLLTLLLVFVVLAYTVPLRSMATSFAAFLGGRPDLYRGAVGELFLVYGVGFIAMSLVTAALFQEVLRKPALDPADRQVANGQRGIWLILAGTGIVSVVLSLFSVTQFVAPFAYATLPISIGIFSARWRWTA